MSELLEDWKGYLSHERGLAPATVKLYGRYLESLAREAGDPLSLDTADLRAWLQGKRGSAGSVGNRISALKSFYSFLVRTGARAKDPSQQLVAPQHRPSPGKPVDNLDEVLDKLDDVDRRANKFSATPRRVGESRDMAIFLSETGLRISDAVSCEWPVPCPQEASIKVGRRTDTLTISEDAREAWNRLGGKWPTGARATQRRFEKAGFNPHQLRHWHKAYKGVRANRPQPGSHPSLALEMAALQQVVSDYSEVERVIISDFLSKALRAVESARAQEQDDG